MAGLPFTLRQLEVFERVSELRSFRLASEDLGISQASVSNQLKALEDQLGVRLLNRESGKRPQLTPEGAAFLADLGKFMGAAKALAIHRRTTASQAELPHFHVHALTGNYLLRDFVRPKYHRFLAAHPQIMLDFAVPTIEDDPRAMIGKSRYDLALFPELRTGPAGDGFRQLGQLRCGVFGNRKLLEGRNTPLTADALNEFGFVLPPAGSHYEGLTLKLLAEHGIKPAKIVARSPYFDAMSAMFQRGLAVGVTLETMITKEEQQEVSMLYFLENFSLTYYRNPESTAPEVDLAEDFLISAVLDDPNFPATAVNSDC